MGTEMGNNTSELQGNWRNISEEDNTAQDKSQQGVAYAEDLKGQNHLVPATQDKDSQGKETGLVFGDVGREDPNGDDQKTDNKEEDNMKTEGNKSLQDAARKEDDKEQNHDVSPSEDTYIKEKEIGLASINLEGLAKPHGDVQRQEEKAEDENTPGNQKELVSSEHDGITSHHAENRMQDEKEKDNSTNLVEAKEKSLQEAASTDEIKAQAHLVPATEDKNSDEVETGLVSRDPDGVAVPRVDNQKHDEKEDINKNDKANEKSSQEAACTDIVERQDQLLPTFGDKNTHGISETGLVSSDPEGTADPHANNPIQDEKEEDNMLAEPQVKEVHADDIEEKNLIIPAAQGEDCNNAGAELDFGDLVVVGDTLDNQTLEGQEQGKTGPHSPTEYPKVEEKPSQDVGEGRESQPASSSNNLEDHEMQQESSFEENLLGTSHHFENQNSMMKEDEGTRNSISDAASCTSHDAVPQEPAVLEPEEHELAKIHTEQPVKVCNGPLKSENMIIPTLTCPEHEKGFILDSSISTDMVDRVIPDPCLEVEKERDGFSVKEMATKGVRSEEKFELEDEDEAANNSGNTTTIMTGLPHGHGVKCNGELPSEMNSIKNDSPESQVEAILSDKTQNFLLEVSRTEDKGMVLSEKATLVREGSEIGNGEHSHCQIRSGQESIEKSNGLGSEEGSKADARNAFPPQFMKNGHLNEEKRRLLDASSDSKSCIQFEEPKIVQNGHLVDQSINYQNEATQQQQKDSQKVHLVTDPAVISADVFLTDQKYKEEEESEEKKFIEEMIEKMEDSNPIGNHTSRKENGEQRISRSYPREQAETFLSLSPFLHALPEKQQQDSHMERKKVHNSYESMVELKQECSGEFSTTEASFVTKNLTEKTLLSLVELAGEKPPWDLSQCQKPTPVTMVEIKPSLKQSSEQRAIAETSAIANGDYYQQESVGRLSSESNPDNMSIHAQMQKSPSFDLDLRIDARAEESDQTPLLHQDTTRIESFPSHADISDLEKSVASTEYGKNSLEYEAMAVEEKVDTLERSDSEKSKTPFLGFLKEEEEADQMSITPKKQDNQSAPKTATKVSAKEVVTSASTKGKQKRKPRTSLFGSCMCCATVIN